MRRTTRPTDPDQRHEDATVLIHSRRIAGPLLVIYLAVVAFIVFWPTGEIASDSVGGIHDLLENVGAAPGWVTPRLIEFVTNVLLFVPLPILGLTFRPRWGLARWTAAGFAGTVFIETVQLVALPGRSATWFDIAANTLGAAVGYLTAATLIRRA